MGLFGKLVSFGVGVYTGMYISQKYDVPTVDDPEKLWKKVQDFLDQHRKN